MKSPLRSSHKSLNVIHIIQTSLPITITIHNLALTHHQLMSLGIVVPSKIVGSPVKIPGTAGKFHGNPVSGNQPSKWPPTSIKELLQSNLAHLIPMMNHFYEGWEGLGAELAKKVTKGVIHKA